jgi:hypothetical protein
MLETLARHLDVARLAATASMLAMIGCTGLIDAPAPTKAEIARQKWVDLALPALDRATCLVCHGGAAPRPMVDFLIGADSIAIHDKVMAFEPAVISLDAPQSSRLLNKGQHEGPPLVGNDKSDVLEWLQAEKEAATDVPGPGQLGLRTQDYAFSVCTGGLPGSTTCPINELALDTLGEGAGIPGAKITFVVQAVGSGIYLNNLKLVPGTSGAYIEHPLFASIPTDPMAKPIADTLDRFFNTKMNLMANATADQQQIAGGTAAFVNFPPENKLAIFFKSAKLYQPEAGGGTTGGCKVLTQFETSARVPLNTNCGGCHRGQNANATSALDLTGADQANAMNACNQARLRLNLTDIPNSGLFLAPTPGNANHPYPFTNNLTGFNNFKTALNPWIIAERDAP